MADKFLHVHDGELGYVPRAGANGYVRDGGSITIETNGFRYTGEKPASSDTPLLAVGDSFTYGEDVGDLEAWPAQLQRLIGRSVLNGGVSGYGLDQIVLRAERLTVVHRPAVVIVGLIADDIRRTEMRRMWWQDKPWFAIEEGRLVLKGVPVPDHMKLPLDMRRRIERLLIQLPPALQYLTGHSIRVHRDGAGAEISRRLIERLADLQSAGQVKVVLVAQYDARAWLDSSYANEQKRALQPLLKCAASNGIATLDTFHRLVAEPRPSKLYGAAHMNARGNLMIASLISARLQSSPH